MKNIYVAICFVFAVVTSVSAQWQPLKGFKGGNIRVRASGQVIIASTAGSTYFYSGDAGASWHLRQINGIPTPGIWNGNIIQCDSMGNLLIDYNCSNNLVFVSSYFKDNNRVVAGFAVGANNRIFANAVNTSLGIRELYYSDDTCRTWTLTPVNGAPVASGNFIYAFNGAERYSSVDNGVTWDSAAATNLLLGQSAHGSVIAYGQNVGIGINYSTDAGQTWHFKGVGGTNASSLTVGDSAIYFSGSGPWGGLYKIDYVSGNVVLVDSNSFSDPSIQSLSYANGKIWMGTTGDGLYAYDEHTKVVSKPVNDVYARNVDQCYFNHNQILATQRWYTNYGGEERYELMYSNDYGASFNSKKIKYVNINVPAVVDTQIYYLSRNDTGYTNQFYTLLGSTEDDLCGLAHLFSNPQKIFNIDSIFMVVCGSSISDGYLFRSPDLGLHWDSIHYFPLGIYDARQWQDSVFVSSGSRVYAFDKAGNLAYSMFLNIGSSGSGSIPPL
ncbi:MAG: hypothetical protein JWO06_509, partial [Bacteroidota bacterium]|nr:hypothetical protein [Bacteroidota bacterium]